MLRSLSVLLLAAWLGLAALAPARAATPSFPEGSRIGLVLPPGNLKPSKRFPGFEDSARNVTITLLDLPPAPTWRPNRALSAIKSRG